MSFILVFLADVSRSLATNNDDDEDENKDEDPAVFIFFCHDFVCFFFSFLLFPLLLGFCSCGPVG